MKTIKAYRADGSYAEYTVPSPEQALAYSKATWGREYDPVERRVVEGGIAMRWAHVER